MRLIKLAALSLLLSVGAATAAPERAAAKDVVTQPAQGAPVLAPLLMAQATLTPTPPDAPPPASQPAPPPPPAAAAPPPAASAPGGSASAVTHNNVNLRNGPGTSFTVITLIPAGSSVDVHECKNGWCEAAFQGQNGYLVESSIAPGAPAAAARARPRPGPGYYAGGYAGGPLPGYEAPPPAYYAPPPGYYAPPPAYGYYPYGPYYRPWGWGRGYWRRW